MQWSDFVTALAAELAMSQTITNPALATPSTNTDFNNILPRCVEFTELMMLRDGDLDFLQVRGFDATTSTIGGSRTIAMPATIILPFELNVITPAGSTTPDLGTRNPVQRASIEWISMLYSTASTATGLPIYYALTDNNSAATPSLQVRLGPTPDNTYTAEWYGQIRPAPLSATNVQNFLSVNLPDLYLSASMVFMSGYIRNFGAQSDDPKMALAWSAIYQEQKKGAAVEQARLKAQGASWSGYAPTPIATPPRQ